MSSECGNTWSYACYICSITIQTKLSWMQQIDNIVDVIPPQNGKNQEKTFFFSSIFSFLNLYFLYDFLALYRICPKSHPLEWNQFESISVTCFLIWENYRPHLHPYQHKISVQTIHPCAIEKYFREIVCVCVFDSFSLTNRCQFTKRENHVALCQFVCLTTLHIGENKNKKCGAILPITSITYDSNGVKKNAQISLY